MFGAEFQQASLTVVYLQSLQSVLKGSTQTHKQMHSLCSRLQTSATLQVYLWMHLRPVKQTCMYGGILGNAVCEATNRA